VPWATINALGPFFTPGIRCIDEVVLTGSAASISFTGIDDSYRDLMLPCQARSDQATEYDNAAMRFNNDSGNNYDWVYKGAHAGNVFAASGGAGVNLIRIAQIEAANSRANVFTPFVIWIQGYRFTDRETLAYSSNSGRFGDRSGLVDLFIRDHRGAWRSQNAVTRIDLFPTTGPNFVSGSRFTLYGLL
jgi:hypothetical protein